MDDLDSDVIERSIELIREQVREARARRARHDEGEQWATILSES